MATRCSLPVLVKSRYGPKDSRRRRVTVGVFALGPTRPCFDRDVWANQDSKGFICERSGIWFGQSQLRIDGKGRNVGLPFYSRGNR